MIFQLNFLWRKTDLDCQSQVSIIAVILPKVWIGGHESRHCTQQDSSVDSTSAVGHSWSVLYAVLHHQVNWNCFSYWIKDEKEQREIFWSPVTMKISWKFYILCKAYLHSGSQEETAAVLQRVEQLPSSLPSVVETLGAHTAFIPVNTVYILDPSDLCWS